MSDKHEHRKPGRPLASSVDVPTSQRILQVAARLFMVLGFEGVSMGQVADDCDITKAMVYYYFSSKANLFTEAMVQLMDTILQRTLAILNRDEPLYDRLLLIMRTRLRIDATLDFNAIMRGSHAQLTESQLEVMHQAEKQLLETIAHAFQVTIEAGQLRDVDAFLAARVYMALIKVGKEDRDDAYQPTVDVDIRSEQLLQFMWMGIDLAK